MDNVNTRAGSGVPGKSPEPIHVLLIDAHALVLRFMTFAFSSHGCVIHSASAAEDARHVLATEPVDLVVADIDLPGLPGADLIQMVADSRPGIPVVITSAVANESAAAALCEQAYDYLKQPFSAEDVERIVTRLVEERRQRAQASPPAPAAGPGPTEGLHRLGDLALQDLDTGAFVEEALSHILGTLGGQAALVLLRDEDGHVTVIQRGDRDVAGRLVGLATDRLEALFAGAGDACLPLGDAGGEISGLAVPFPGPGKVTSVLCLGSGALDNAKAWLPVYARVIAVALQKIALTESLEGNVIDTISSFVVALEAKDIYLKGHSARVSLYVGELAKGLGLPPGQVAMARRAGILHDLGKLVINDAIYRKPGALTDEGSQLMREHPAQGASILKPLRFLAQEAEAIWRHHERYDGGGYPDGLKGDNIPLAARLIAVADAFDDMTSSRPYRAPMRIEQAVQDIVRHGGTQFDPAVTDALANIPVARLTEIAGFYESPTEAPAERTARSPLALVAASKRLFRRKGWSSGHAAERTRRNRQASGAARAAFRRQA
jgi:putative nucleotidyltransferase with HDIG domain